MANRITLGDVWELKIFCYAPLQKQVSVNIMHYFVSGIGGAGPRDTVAAGIFEAVYAADYKGVLSDDVDFRGVSLQRMAPLPKTVPATSSALAGAGTFGPNILPLQTSAVITKITNGVGRKKRGRFYVAFPPPNAAATTGQLTAAYMTACQTLVADMHTVVSVPDGVDIATMVPVICPKTFLTQNPVLSARINAGFGTQRRRGAYGRTNPPPVL